jgi:hypothetical protein
VTIGPIAHGIGGVKDLPVPGWLFLYGAAVVLVASFVALTTLWKRPHFDAARRGRPLAPAVQRVLLSRALRVVFGSIGFGLLVFVAVAALFGDRNETRNLAPTFVYVFFWLGLVPVVALVGNVWSILNPWRAAADGAAALWARAGRTWEPLLDYPERLGRWPAAVLLFAFTALELAYTDPADPRRLALAIYLYSMVTWIGMIIFGRRAWLVNGEAFTVYFGLLARIAPLGVRRRAAARHVVLRAPLVGLARKETRAGSLAFVAVMLGSVAFDGFSRTTAWGDLRASVFAAAPGSFEVVGIVLNLGGLLGAVVLVALAYLGAVWTANAFARDTRSLTGAFVPSLVPIALVYVVAHYFSLVVIQGQVGVRLASDPLGWDWNVFGTADFRPNLMPLSPNTIWYVQVVSLVVGHVAGLLVAHDRAVALFRSATTALTTQLAMLALMVLYTVGGLWVLSQG